MIKKFFILLLAIVASVGMSYALEPLSGDSWDNNTKTLTVNSDPQEDSYHEQSEIRRLVISSSVIEIGDNAFSGCDNLESVFAYGGLQGINNEAFAYCPKLESVILPASLQIVGTQVFAYCENLKYVTINAPSLTYYGQYAFDGTHANLTVYVPEASLATYKTSWSAYADKFQAIPSSLAVGDTLKVGDAMYSATDVYVDAGYLRFQIKASSLHTISVISVSSENIKVEFTPYAEEFYPSGSYAALTNWFYCPSEYTSGDVSAITVVSGAGTLADPFVIDYVKPAAPATPATTEVTITQDDFPDHGESISFTKDGVTVSAGEIDGISGYLTGGGSFSTTLGNFTKIEVNAMNIGSLGEGWSGSSTKKTWTGNASSVSFSGNIYGYGELTLKFTIGDAAPAGPIPCTPADLGKVLCTDGSIYATVSEATAASKTAAAVIAYVDTQNGKALALALADDGDEMNWATAKTTAAAHTPAVSGGTWTLASKDDWNNMITAAGSYTALRDGFSGVGGTNMLVAEYWTSTEGTYSGTAIGYRFQNGKWTDPYVDDPLHVRACLAFDIPATPAYETVMNLINEIPNPVVLTAECKAKIDAARAAFDALSTDDKALVTNLATLEAAEQAYADAKQAADQAVADPVIALINQLPNPMTAADVKLSVYTKVQDARAAFDALTADQKLLVTNLAVLEAAEAAFAPYVGGGGAPLPDGALSGAFSINASGDKIVFSKGNLQYVGSWQFATNQWDAFATDQSDDHRDLFGWGTKNNPNNVSADNADYTWAEWGENAISNGGDQANAGWRTLTNDEWTFLLNTRSAATRFAKAYLFSTTHGLILFPDNYSHPAGLAEIAGINSTASASWNGNQYSAADWTKMEAAGAVFLPLTGYRSGTSISEETEAGEYWTSTPSPSNTEFSYYLYFSDAYLSTYTYGNRVGNAVRLVISADAAGGSVIDDAKAAVDLINAIPTPVTLDSKDAIDAARAAVTALGEAAKLIDGTDMDKLTQAEADYIALIKAEADAVIAKINAIPQPVTLKLATRDSINNARAAYDALTADQQALVTNYQTLLDAEATWATLNPGGGMPAGALSGKFSINADGDQIAFSKGNLQATTTDLGEHWTWGFAANQWEVIGDAVANTAITGSGTVSENGTVDLFGWSTPTTYYGIHNSTNSDYYSDDFREWGENITGATWKTLSPSDWIYIISNRADAAQKQGQATVNGVNGYIFLPDEWEIPTGLSFTAKPNNWTANVYEGDDWTAMENAGAVFLPKSSWRKGNTVSPLAYGYYWSSDYNNYSNAMAYYFKEDLTITGTGIPRYAGIYVRLVTADAGSPSPLDSAQAVKELIDAIPVPVTLDDACVDAIHAAQDAYNALAEATKGALDAATVQKLTDAEAALTALNQAVADKVVAKINNIPQPVELKLATRDSIENARAAYDALTADQQALVTNYQKLLDAEDALAEKNQGGSVPMDIVWDGNTGIENVSPTTTSPAYEGMTVTVGNGSSFSTYQNRLYFTFYSQPNGGFIFANENGTNITKVVIESTTALTSTMTEVDRMGSGWVISNEDKTATWTGNADSVSIWKGQSFTNYWVVDTITFTVNGVGATPLDSAQVVKDLIEAIPAEITLEDACVDAVQAARDAYDALSDAAKGALDDATVQKLNQAITDYTALIQSGADAVKDKINAIPAQIELLISTKHAIEDARAAYDALTADQKALVSNYQKLTDAEATWAQIYAGHEDEMVQAEAVAALIEAIPQPVVLTSECENAINLANDAFSQLLNEQKAMLGEPLVQKLTDALATYKSLADQDAAEAVIARIDALPSPIAYNADCKEALDDARAAYDALSDEAKALISAEELKKLTDAEAAYAALAAEIEFNVEFLGKNQTAMYKELIALTKMPNGAPDENGWAFDHWEVMPTPMYAGLHLQAVYRYLITLLPQAYDTLMYNGLAQTLIAAGEAEEGHLEYRIGEGAWSAELPQATNAGTYAIQYKLVREGHEDFIAPDTVYANIAKAPVTYVAPVAYDTLVYNYAAQELILAGQTEDGTFEYTLTPDNENSWSTMLSQGTDAGAYSVYFRVIGDMNHMDSVAPDPVAVSMAKRDIVVTAPVAYDTLVYNALAQTLAADATADFGTLRYTLTPNDSQSWATTMATGINAGSYTVYYCVAGDKNHNDYAPASIEASIAKALLTVTANDTACIYADAIPAFTASYSGWMGQDTVDLVSGLQFATTYEVGSYVGTYDIIPSGAMADNYTMTYVNGTLTVNPTVVYVTDAEAQTAKFADGHANAVVLKNGMLNGIKLNDPLTHITTAAFSTAEVSENVTITLFYELTGDEALLANYYLEPVSEIFTADGVIIEPFLPNNEGEPEDEEARVQEGIEVYAYGYCDGSGYDLRYHLSSGYPDQYKIEFEDARFTDVDYPETAISGRDGNIFIEIPADLPTGDYSMTVTFRDSRFDWLESNPMTVTFHVNLPQTYVVALFDNVMAIVDTCECLTDIQWYWRADASQTWTLLEGATGYYCKQDGGLSGEYIVRAKMNGVETYTCPQDDMTLYGAEIQQANLTAYPNPVITTTTLSIENSAANAHTFRIVNLMGQEVMHGAFEGDTTVVNMSACPSGNYMISVDGIVVKVIKQ